MPVVRKVRKVKKVAFKPESPLEKDVFELLACERRRFLEAKKAGEEKAEEVKRQIIEEIAKMMYERYKIKDPSSINPEIRERIKEVINKVLR